MEEAYLTVPFDLCAVVEEGGVKRALKREACNV
jgi:hypothetical protein